MVYCRPQNHISEHFAVPENSQICLGYLISLIFTFRYNVRRKYDIISTQFALVCSPVNPQMSAEVIIVPKSGCSINNTIILQLNVRVINYVKVLFVEENHLNVYRLWPCKRTFSCMCLISRLNLLSISVLKKHDQLM